MDRKRTARGDGLATPCRTPLAESTTIETPTRSTAVDRFWSHVDRTGDGCWLWTAYTDDDGYGICMIGGRHWRAHRLAWTLINGPIPQGLMVLHGCDTPACTRPGDGHTYLGTAKDNARDVIERRRRQVLSEQRLIAAGQLRLFDI